MFQILRLKSFLKAFFVKQAPFEDKSDSTMSTVSDGGLVVDHFMSRHGSECAEIRTLPSDAAVGTHEDLLAAEVQIAALLESTVDAGLHDPIVPEPALTLQDLDHATGSADISGAPQHQSGTSTRATAPLKGAAPLADIGDEAQRCLRILVADRARCGTLAADRVDSLCEKRDLTAAERAWLYRELDIAEIESDEVDEDDVEEQSLSRTDHVDFLIRSIGHVKLLSADQERILGRQIRNGLRLREALNSASISEDAGVRKAIARAEIAHGAMVLANIRLVVKIAHKYNGVSTLDFADLVHEGIVGLMKAVEKYDPELGYKLSTYATWWIRQSITRAIHDTGRTIRFPVHFAEKIAKLRKTLRRLELTTGKSPSISRLAAELGWPYDDTEEIYAYLQMSFTSVDVDEEDDDARPPLVLRDTSPSPEELYELREMKEMVRKVVEELPDREREIIERRFGFDPSDDEEETLAQIGDDYGVTRERIRQIEAKALRRLSHPRRIKPLLIYKLDEKASSDFEDVTKDG